MGYEGVTKDRVVRVQRVYGSGGHGRSILWVRSQMKPRPPSTEGTLQCGRYEGISSRKGSGLGRGCNLLVDVSPTEVPFLREGF